MPKKSQLANLALGRAKRAKYKNKAVKLPEWIKTHYGLNGDRLLLIAAAIGKAPKSTTHAALYRAKMAAWRYLQLRSGREGFGVVLKWLNEIFPQNADIVFPPTSKFFGEFLKAVQEVNSESPQLSPRATRFKAAIKMANWYNHSSAIYKAKNTLPLQTAINQLRLKRSLEKRGFTNGLAYKKVCQHDLQKIISEKLPKSAHFDSSEWCKTLEALGVEITELPVEDQFTIEVDDKNSIHFDKESNVVGGGGLNFNPDMLANIVVFKQQATNNKSGIRIIAEQVPSRWRTVCEKCGSTAEIMYFDAEMSANYIVCHECGHSWHEFKPYKAYLKNLQEIALYNATLIHKEKADRYLVWVNPADIIGLKEPERFIQKGKTRPIKIDQPPENVIFREKLIDYSSPSPYFKRANDDSIAGNLRDIYLLKADLEVAIRERRWNSIESSYNMLCERLGLDVKLHTEHLEDHLIDSIVDKIAESGMFGDINYYDMQHYTEYTEDLIDTAESHYEFIKPFLKKYIEKARKKVTTADITDLRGYKGDKDNLIRTFYRHLSQMGGIRRYNFKIQKQKNKIHAKASQSSHFHDWFKSMGPVVRWHNSRNWKALPKEAQIDFFKAADYDIDGKGSHYHSVLGLKRITLEGLYKEAAEENRDNSMIISYIKGRDPKLDNDPDFRRELNQICLRLAEKGYVQYTYSLVCIKMNKIEHPEINRLINELNSLGLKYHYDIHLDYEVKHRADGLGFDEDKLLTDSVNAGYYFIAIVPKLILDDLL